MKKITLMDIMESLDSENIDDVSAALHEWFVDSAKQVHAQLTGETVVESDEEDEAEDEKVEESSEAVAEDDSEDLDEDRVDELSRDTMMTYAKKARKDRDSSSADDEKVGRRVAGLDMVANKARREKASLQYEAEGSAFRVTADFVWEDMHGDFPYESASKVFHAASAEEAQAMAQAEIAQYDGDPKFALGELVWEHEWEEGSSGSMDGPERIEILKVEPVAAVESVIESEEEEKTEEQVEESVDDLIAELHEAFQGLETVSDKLQNVEGAQVGEEGKVPVNKKSTLPSKKSDKRVGGEPVEIKADEHKGHALEKAPVVKDAPVKGHVQNSKDDPKKVGAEKGALLNKMDGSVNTQSPISGKGAKGLKK
jgi:hypothetical protein